MSAMMNAMMDTAMNTTEQRKDDLMTAPAPPRVWTERAFEAGWVALVVACAAEVVCRLL